MKNLQMLTITLTHYNKRCGLCGSRYRFYTQLTADSGYHLPDAIEIKAGENVLAKQDYTYDAKTGDIVVKADRLKSGVKLTISAQAEEDVKMIIHCRPTAIRKM